MIGAEAGRTTAENYRRFAEREARGKSALYEELATGIADDDEVLTLIDTLPPGKRQPNLMLAAARFSYGTPAGYPELRGTLIEHWAQVRSVALARSTQTNEVGRCAALLPVLAELPQPLALIEIGASAGLCLLALATGDPPPVVRGDLRTDLARLVARAPADATVVVFHSAVLAYLPADDRARFAEQVAGLDLTWIGFEAPGVVAVADPPPAPPPDPGSAFLITHDGRPVAWADPHGAWLRRT